MFLHFTDQVALAVGIAPAADAFAGTVSSDVVNLANYSKLVAIINRGNGATGTSTITMQACDNVAGDNPVAVPFSVVLQDADGANRGAKTDVEATGFTTAAGANKVYTVELQADALPEGKKCVFMKAVEVVDSAVPGSVELLLFGGRYQGADLKVPTI